MAVQNTEYGGHRNCYFTEAEHCLKASQYFITVEGSLAKKDLADHIQRINI